MNKIILIGNLTRDPELAATPNGVTVCKFSIAVDRRYDKNQDGSKKTDFFRIAAWRQLGENCAKYLVKGKKVAVTGELNARTFVAKDNTVQLSLDVSADEVEFLSPKEQTAPAAPVPTFQQNLDSYADIEDDDIPF